MRFCGTRAHRKGDNRCGNKRVCCANCKESHPSSYRGCIAFLREKEAHRIRAKEKTPLHNARRLASAKEFPHLNRPRGEQQGPTNNNPVTEPRDPRRSSDPRGPRDSRGPRDTPRDYAGAVSASNLAQASNTPTQSAETQPTRANTEENNAQEQETVSQVPVAQEAAAQIGSQACHKCTCNGEDRNLERKLNNILKKTITKLLVGITQVLTEFSLAQEQGNTLNEKNKLDIIIKRISHTIDEDLSLGSDSSEHLSSSEEYNENSGEEEDVNLELHPSNRQTTRYIPAKERNSMKRKKKKKCL